MDDIKIMFEMMAKAIIFVGSFAGLIAIAMVLVKGAGWAARLEQQVSDGTARLEQKIDSGFMRNNEDHGVIKDFLDEHTALLSTHAKTLVEHRVRIKGLEHKVYGVDIWKTEESG